MPGPVLTPTHPPYIDDALTPQRAARMLYAYGYRALAMHLDDRRLAVAIVRAFTAAGVPVGDMRGTAEQFAAVRIELACLVEAATPAKLDPDHIDAVRAEGARYARRTA